MNSHSSPVTPLHIVVEELSIVCSVLQEFGSQLPPEKLPFSKHVCTPVAVYPSLQVKVQVSFRSPAQGVAEFSIVSPLVQLVFAVGGEVH